MHIVELTPSLGVGGAERIVALLGGALQCRGHRVDVISLYAASGSWIEEELAQQGVTVHFLGKSRGYDPRVVSRLAALLRRLQPEVVHTHLHVHKYLAPARIGLQMPVVHTLHNLAEHEADVPGKAYRRRAFGRDVEPVAIGEAVAASAELLYGTRPRFVVPNGIEVDAFQPREGAREQVRAALGAGDRPVLLGVGRLSEQKDPAQLVRAMADPGLSHAQLWLAGDGPLRPALEALRDQLGLQERVRLLGRRSDVPDLLAAADVFVLASRWEGNPLVVMEAMAAGCPVVATTVGCVPELVTPDVGSLVRPGNLETLVRNLRSLAADLDRARHMGTLAAERARTHFDVSVMTDGYEAVFRTVGQH